METITDPSVNVFLGCSMTVWFAGYCLGHAFRFVRQIFEKAARS